MNTTMSLHQLGWSGFFQQQLSLDEFENCRIARVLEHHRTRYLLQTETEQLSLTIKADMPALTVGDWLLIDADKLFIRALDRLTLLSRKAAGSKVAEQLIAANVNTLFIVNALNHDFNLSRIERYLAIAHESGCEPVIILTKQDCCENVDDYLQQIHALDSLLMVEAVNSLDVQSVEKLHGWCKTGQTVAFVGSSGVGKSTLVNTLMQEQILATAEARADDDKGRHTTTSRSLFVMPTGGVLLDTPGIRELKIADCEEGINAAFSDISELATQCRFSDCSHQAEPGCAVQKALKAGIIDERRLTNFFKLLREQKRNGATLAESRSADKNLTKFYKKTQNLGRLNKQSGD
ncbi:putative ribosome biogenesis GTPase RsgA 2 [Psychromonas marina]|uniref:Small ribosomal subunit biogenesis GTPase RsgA n=1 Tax=Psychromonas marina TaxID=88364 RepID=A0ABQ6E3T0_9GAMM|nr:ribosome small subunit-dependent GTPase A [Psychromonas marina]GLS91865.1 putative ribosome biogenesis GTPase RsgA 2 [Psychromonas marina]